MKNNSDIDPHRERSVEQFGGAPEYFELALEAGEIGTWEWDLVTGEMRWSAQMFRNLGLPVGMHGDLYSLLLEAIHPDERALAETTLAEFAKRDGPMRLEVQLAPIEDPHWVVFLGRTIAGSDGVPTRMLGITIDSTRRRKTEEAAAAALREGEQRLRQLNEELEERVAERTHQLEASRAQMQAILNTSPDWLTLFRATPDGRFVYEDLNPATERAYGLSRDRVIGRSVDDILGPEQAQLPIRVMRACIETGDNQRYTAQRSLAGTTRTIDVMFVKVAERGQGDPFIMATARDITEREQVEERLRQSQKMEAVGQLTGGLAHDFNNLLTAVIGSLDLLTLRLHGDPVSLDYIAAAQRAAENGAKLTEQLLVFSRRQQLQPRAVALNAVIGEMHELLARTIGPTIRVHTVLSPALWRALVDPTQIEVAILNLAVNARDAMPLGGTLEIETQNLPVGASGVPPEIGDADCVRVSVRDTGTGMSEEVLRSAIEPFFTTKEPGKGSGLGLSQVYGTVRQANGGLQIESRLGAGTAVHLYLPRTVAEDATLDGGAPRDHRGQSRGRILVIDDDSAVRAVTVGMLRQSGYDVAEADSGPAALHALAGGETYDLLVADIVMPGMSGIEAVRLAREKRPELRALYVTGYVESPAAASGIGDDPLIKKPFRLADLTAEVARALTLTGGGAGNVLPLRRRR